MDYYTHSLSLYCSHERKENERKIGGLATVLQPIKKDDVRPVGYVGYVVLCCVGYAVVVCISPC